MVNATRNLEGLGKTYASYTDKLVTEIDIDTPTPEEADKISEDRRANIALSGQKIG